MRLFKPALLVLPLLLLCACSVTRAMRVDDHQIISVKDMIGEVKGSRLVLVGERHDAPAHHRLQLQVIKGLQGSGKPVALGMEMFEGVSQSMLDAWVAGQVEERTFVGLYRWNWRNLPWDLYREILLYARDQHIPVIALNAPRDVVQKVSQLGLSSLNEKELGLLPAGVDQPVEDEYFDLLRSAYPVHGRNFRYICEAQMLRNRVMARRIDDYLEKNPDAVMVVLAGGGHVREKGGIPAELKLRSYKIILPSVPGMTEREVTRSDGTYLMEDPVLDLL